MGMGRNGFDGINEATKWANQSGFGQGGPPEVASIWSVRQDRSAGRIGVSGPQPGQPESERTHALTRPCTTHVRKGKEKSTEYFRTRISRGRRVRAGPARVGSGPRVLGVPTCVLGVAVSVGVGGSGRGEGVGVEDSVAAASSFLGELGGQKKSQGNEPKAMFDSGDKKNKLIVLEWVDV